LRVEARSFGYDRRLAPQLGGATTRADMLVILLDDGARLLRRELNLRRRRPKP
jgi:hypothetical protein